MDEAGRTSAWSRRSGAWTRASGWSRSPARVAAAVQAGCDAAAAVGELHEPGLRAGVHLGRPRKLGGDYFGVDVNVAARVASAAGGGEVLVSDAVRDRLDPAQIATRRRWRFKPKGAPKGLHAYVAERQAVT